MRPILVVDTTADRDQPCVAGAQLARAVELRLPGVAVQQKGVAHGDDLVARLRHRGATWALTLERADGSAVLTRSLQLATHGCKRMANTGALIIDRFLTDLRWPGLPAQIDPETVGLPAPAPSPAEPNEPRRSEAVQIVRVSVGLGLAGRTVGDTTNLGGILEADLVASHAIHLGVEAVLFARSRHPVISSDALYGDRRLGSVVVLPAALLASIGRCWGSGFEVCADGVAGATYTRVESRGQDVHGKVAVTKWRAALGVSVRLGYDLPWWSRHLRATAGARAIVRISRARFAVEGIADPVYESPTIEGIFTAGLAYNFFK